MAIKVTEMAVRELKKAIAEQQLPETVAVRIGVASGGCSGFEYNLLFDENISDDKDLLTEFDANLLKNSVDLARNILLGDGDQGAWCNHQRVVERLTTLQ